MPRPPSPDRRTRLAAVAGALTGSAVALLFGHSAIAGLTHGWDSVVLPAFYALSLSGFATCL